MWMAWKKSGLRLRRGYVRCDLLSARRWAENDVVDHPDFLFVVGAFGFDDFVNFSGVMSSDTGGVKVELALFLGEEFAFES